MVRRNGVFTEMSARRVCGLSPRQLDAEMCLTVFVPVFSDEHLSRLPSGMSWLQKHADVMFKNESLSPPKNLQNFSDKQHHSLGGSNVVAVPLTSCASWSEVRNNGLVFALRLTLISGTDALFAMRGHLLLLRCSPWLDQF